MYVKVIKSLVISIAILIISIFAALFIADPKDGFPVNTKDFPVEAKVLIQKYGITGMPKDEMRRLNKIMKENGGWSDDNLFAKSIIQSWYIFILFPAFACLVIVYITKRFEVLSGVIIFLPNVLLFLLSIFRN